MDDDILSSIPDSHFNNDCARDTRRSMDGESHAVSQNKRSNSSSGICSRGYESKVIRPLQNRRKEHDCIKEITDATVALSSDKKINESSSLHIPRSSDRSKQKTLDTVECHNSPIVLLTPTTTQNKSRSPPRVPVPVIRHSGEHTNSARRSGENVETMSQREPRVNSLPTFATDIQSNVSESQSDSDNDNCLPNLLSQSNQQILSKPKLICTNPMTKSNHQNLSKPKSICTDTSSKSNLNAKTAFKSNLNAKTASSKHVSNPIVSNITYEITGMIEGNIENFKYLIGKIHRDNEDFQRYVTDKVYVDKESRNIVGERILILKEGRRNRSRDPRPIHIRDIEEMTRQ